MAFITLARVSKSMWAKGSSSSRTSGFAARARAMSIRFISPEESERGKASRWDSFSPTCSSARREGLAVQAPRSAQGGLDLPEGIPHAQVGEEGEARILLDHGHLAPEGDEGRRVACPVRAA